VSLGPGRIFVAVLQRRALSAPVSGSLKWAGV
jgi:hypothetical protein